MSSLPIPHTPPFRFLDALVERDDDGAVFRYRVPAEGDSFALRMFPALLLVEALAQAAAAWHGLTAAADGGVEQGVLASVDKVRVHGRPRPGQALRLRVRQRKVFGAMVLLDGQVKSEEGVMLQAEIVVRRGTP